MSIHYLRCSVQLTILAKRAKQIFEKTHYIQGAGAANNSERVIVMYAVMAILWSNRQNLHCDLNALICRSAGLGRSFGQMHNHQTTIIPILNYIAYFMLNVRTLNYILIKNPTLTCPVRHLQGFNVADS